MYKLYPQNPQSSQAPNSVERLDDGASIPFDPANTCYQAYLKWLSEGNEPLPPDEPAVENEQPSA